MRRFRRGLVSQGFLPCCLARMPFPTLCTNSLFLPEPHPPGLCHVQRLRQNKPSLSLAAKRSLGSGAARPWLATLGTIQTPWPGRLRSFSISMRQSLPGLRARQLSSTANGRLVLAGCCDAALLPPSPSDSAALDPRRTLHGRDESTAAPRGDLPLCGRSVCPGCVCVCVCVEGGHLRDEQEQEAGPDALSAYTIPSGTDTCCRQYEAWLKITRIPSQSARVPSDVDLGPESRLPGPEC
jgi:hypothetical protein